MSPPLKKPGWRRNNRASALFTHALFAKWIAVKNGLYKMALTSNHTGTFPSGCELLEELIAKETGIARSLTATVEQYRRQDS